jgi:hypothetical protein
MPQSGKNDFLRNLPNIGATALMSISDELRAGALFAL